jgi:hypothetical protein
MSLALPAVVGTIRVEPTLRGGAAQAACDDSTLDLILQSFAGRETLGDDSRASDDSICLLVSKRLCRIQAAAEGRITMRANLAQLLADLQTEYEGLERQSV